MRNIWLIIQRELNVRVRRKAFIITTLVTPLLFAAIMIIPTVLLLLESDTHYDIGVIDRSNEIFSQMESTETMTFTQFQDREENQLEKLLQDSVLSALLVIDKDALTNSKGFTLYAPKTPSLEVTERIDKVVSSGVRKRKIATYDIPGLQEAMDDINRSISIRTVSWKKSGELQENSTGLVSGIGYVLGFLIYIMIFASGGMVMNGILQEKTNRIVEVLMSSVKSVELMIGKILGVASVVLLQILLWGVLTVIFASIAGFFIPSSGAAASDIASMAGPASDHTEFTEIFSTAKGALGSINFFSIIFGFIFYFIFGYLLYASMFAAVGAAVDDPQDASQLLTPITIPLIIGIFTMVASLKSPDGAIAFWFSMIPFTSPITMPTRLALGVPTWQLLLSGGLLIGTFLVISWLASKIYVHGILIFGKKHSWREILKWLRD